MPILSSIDANRTDNRASLDCLSAECGNDREDRLLKKYGQRSAMSVVVSLFSEVDGDLEHDTLSVMGRDTMAGRDVWVVRFADPVITTRVPGGRENARDPRRGDNAAERRGRGFTTRIRRRRPPVATAVALILTFDRSKVDLHIDTRYESRCRRRRSSRAPSMS